MTIESHAHNILRTQLGNPLSKDDQNVVLDHGTDHQSACDILFRGIARLQLWIRILFDNSGEALNWAKNATSKPALLVFQVNRQQLLTDIEKLNLFNDHQR